MQLGKIISALDPRPSEVAGATDIEITSIVHDSRLAGPGVLFFDLPSVTPGRANAGTGARHILEAVEKGAAAVVTAGGLELPRVTVVRVDSPRAALASAAATFFRHPSLQLQTAAITGTNGKTTSTFLLKHLLDVAGRPCGLIGTVRYVIGPRELPAARTTPESDDVQQLLREMRDVNCRAAVMEASSHALHQGRLRDVEFDAAVFTNLTQDHLDYHETMEAYFAAKSLLFDQLAGQRHKKGTAVINVDDRYGRRLVDGCVQRVTTVTYGQSSNSAFRAADLRTDFHGTQFSLHAGGKSYLVRLPLFGPFNVYNSLAALATMHALGHDVRKSVVALKDAPQIPGRLELVPGPKSFRVFVDYAHTPDALENVLRTLRSLEPARIVTVFGCGGDRDRAKRGPMGRAAEELSDWCIITSDNPRSEEPESICRQITSSLRGANHEVVTDRRAAIRRAVAMAGPGDIVLVAGKGHEGYQEFADRKVPFDDLAECAASLREKTA
ncbi:MAG: UDP-N-acetylmuramoyl-L-alanyl-D-glutamate--2,6-diaminopimelate ligase [Chthoniobacterales bacterium]|jgi:UDP-N-acetylmuramoyl-L-alanyl-D-glutamate--2,6-diaminopimelate ligase|nr:UDP-N-acetylmuramoyl-L-alanyl-D-glutamate--2,6-diaminopimelate ligase [Chthoniobacterales bacterium]